MSVAAVVIGRNEGARLGRCLASLTHEVAQVVYVDSGSTDGSVAVARVAGAQVIALDMSRPFTAARARNAGLDYLFKTTAPRFVQVVDGDCEMREGWIATATAFLCDNPQVAIVAGRLRERFPEASIWNRLADDEWNTATGRVDAVGGIAMLRAGPVRDQGGYSVDLVAGEEPELCLRLRRAGWLIWRLPEEMAWHDIAMTRFSQWWRRMRRHGRALADAVRRHPDAPAHYARQALWRALVWGAGVPLLAVVGGVFTPWAWLAFLLWPLQVLRLRARGESWPQAVFLTVGKLAEAQGILGSYLGRTGISRPD